MVLDLGCGAGFDTFLTAQTVSRNGKVVGLDMSPRWPPRLDHSTALGCRVQCRDDGEFDDAYYLKR